MYIPLFLSTSLAQIYRNKENSQIIPNTSTTPFVYRNTLFCIMITQCTSSIQPIYRGFRCGLRTHIIPGVIVAAHKKSTHQLRNISLYQIRTYNTPCLGIIDYTTQQACLYQEQFPVSKLPWAVCTHLRIYCFCLCLWWRLYLPNLACLLLCVKQATVSQYD